MIPTYMPNYMPYKLPMTPQMEEKENISFISQRLGFALIIMQVISVALQIIIAVAMALFSQGGAQGVTAIFKDPATLWLMNIAITVPMFIIPFIIGAKMMRVRVGELIPLGKTPFKLTVAVIGATLCIAMVGNAMTGYLSQIFGNLGIDTSPPEYGYPDGILGKLIAVLAISFTPALIEEFAFRGVFMGSLRRFGDNFAIVASALFFGLMHGNLTQIPFAFIVGLALGMSVKITGSLWPAIIAHFFNNFFSVCLDIAIESLSDTYASLISGAYFAVIIILGIISLKWLLGKKQIDLTDNLKASKLYPKDKFKAFFSSPALIVGVILMVGNMVLTYALTAAGLV